MRADRLLAEVALMRTHGRLSAAELARRVEVSPRTVVRDMEALSAAGVPVYAERGRAGGFALLQGYRPPAEELTGDEAQALFIAGGGGVADALGMGAPCRRALRKLATGMPVDPTGGLAQTLSRIVVDPGGWHGAVKHPALLTTVFEAVQTDHRLSIDYRAMSSGKVGVRTVDPWGVVLAGSTWYLLGAHRRRPHTYRLSRMVAAEILPETFTRPADLDVLAIWQDVRRAWGHNQEHHTVRLRVAAGQCDPVIQRMGLILRAEPQVTRGDDGHDLITAEVTSLRGAVGVLLGFGNWLEVLEPVELRDMMTRIAREALAQYES